jgi:hypothetical protein
MVGLRRRQPAENRSRLSIRRVGFLQLFLQPVDLPTPVEYQRLLPLRLRVVPPVGPESVESGGRLVVRGQRVRIPTE